MTYVVVIQRFQPEAFFTTEQQARLQELMERCHEGIETGHDLSLEEKQELEQVVDAEWRAAIQRGAAILGQIRPPTT